MTKFVKYVVVVLLGTLVGMSTASAAMRVLGQRDQERCVVEQVGYDREGLALIGWVMRPKGEGPWPTVVWNHGSRLGANGSDRSQDPTLSLGTPCFPDVASGHRAYFWPEGRGYGGSQGERLSDAIASGGRSREIAYQNVARYLKARAQDANAGVAFLVERGIARRDALAVVGASHGGVVSLFAAAGGDLYRAVIIQATGLCYYNSNCAAEILDAAAAKIRIPFLIQHALNDTLCPPAVSKRLASVASATNPDVAHVEYPGNPDQEGHSYFGPRNFSSWGQAYYDVLTRVCAARFAPRIRAADDCGKCDRPSFADGCRGASARYDSSARKGGPVRAMARLLGRRARARVDR